MRRGTNINSSPPDETFRYCGKRGPPPRLAFIILLKVVPVPLGPPIPQPPARKHCTGDRVHNGKTTSKRICAPSAATFFSQSCEKQIPTKTNARLNQSGMGFGWNLLAGAKPLYHASCCKTRHMPRTVSRDPVARGHGNTVSLATVQITVRSLATCWVPATDCFVTVTE